MRSQQDLAGLPDYRDEDASATRLELQGAVPALYQTELAKEQTSLNSMALVTERQGRGYSPPRGRTCLKHRDG